MSMPVCPECRTLVPVKPDVLASEIVECEECLAELEVLSARPVVLALAPEAEEDWGE